MTTNSGIGSHFLWVLASAGLLACDGPVANANPEQSRAVGVQAASPRAAAPGPAPKHQAAPEAELGVADKGIFSDLDEQIRLAPPEAGVGPLRLAVDTARAVATLYVDGWPVKVYPLGGSAKFEVDGQALPLRPGDAAELGKLGDGVAVMPQTGGAAPRDRDSDGIDDRLDILLGARKTAINAATYGAGYTRLAYPGGDVPRDVGVCTDVVIRSLRNVGIDLQREVHLDIKRAKRAYPMVKGGGNANIDHRRVKTILPYFVRHFERHTADLKDTADPLRPGDIVFMDTFPSRSGPDHIGIISDRVAPSGHPYVINNWTDGTVTTEMDLLDWVPVTDRFRLPS